MFLVHKTLRAVKEYNVNSLLLGGGVASNTKLRMEFDRALTTTNSKVLLFFPEKKFCTDNGAMIAMAAYYQHTPTPWSEITANPELYY